MMGLSPEQEARDLRYAAEDHLAGIEAIALNLGAVAGALEMLHGCACTFFACDGPDEPPVDMATCTPHWAYHELRSAVGDRIRYQREGFAPITLDTYLSLLSTERPAWEPFTTERTPA